MTHHTAATGATTDATILRVGTTHSSMKRDQRRQ